MWAFIALSFCVFLCDLKQSKKKKFLELLKENKKIFVSVQPSSICKDRELSSHRLEQEE